MERSDVSKNTRNYYVLKRSGVKEAVQFDKITARINKLSYGLKNVDTISIAFKVISGMFSGIKTSQLDQLAADSCSTLGDITPDYHVLAARIFVSNLHKETKKKFSEVICDLYSSGLINETIYKTVIKNKDSFDSIPIYDRDYKLNYFGLKTLEKSYLLKINDKVIERPQHLLMRVSVALHGENIEKVQETYDAMSNLHCLHATPTLYNAGCKLQGLSSCFLIAGTKESDSVEGIYSGLLSEAAIISKHSGGIGISIHDIRGGNSLIRSVNGRAGGIKPMLRVFNQCTTHITQAGKRKGSIAFYLEPWHCDIFEFLDLKLLDGKDEDRARDLFYALWIPDLFMERVQANCDWSLFCPNECPGLASIFGDEFKSLYTHYESQNKFRKQVKARKLFEKILDTQIKTGVPYMVYKDTVNKKNNQQHIGTIRSSNLCAEITLHSDENETSVCNLASIGLPSFIKKDDNGQTYFDFRLLGKMAKILTRNLDRVIDITSYPSEKARKSNLKHRPIGIGVSGLADVFFKMRLPFDSLAARKLNKQIFETIYFYALEASCELAQELGKYSTFDGSNFSKGKFQFDLNPKFEGHDPTLNYDWDTLRQNVMKHGTRNSHLTSCQPTASTAQILGNSECIEPLNSNIYKRNVLSGEFQVVNKYLVRDLFELGIYSDSLKDKIMLNRGSIKDITEIPAELRDLYKVAWDLSPRVIMDLSSDRQNYIDHSQSLNIFLAEATHEKLAKVHFYGWELGLKTGMYYLRQLPAVTPLNVTVDRTKHQNLSFSSVTTNEEECVMCSG